MSWYNAPSSTGAGGTGISSIALTGNSPLLITNSPLTSNGTLGITLGAASASANGYLTSGDYATFAAAAAPSGTVILQKPNGTFQYFTSAVDTSTARGTTLLAAVAAAAAGDTIRLGAGAYSTALSGITLNDVDIVGTQQDITSISSTNDTATLNLVNCYISNISITNVSTNGRAIQSSGVNIDSCTLTASSNASQVALDCYNTTNFRNCTANGRVNVRTNGSMYMSDVRIVSPQTIGIYFYAGTTSTLRNVDVTSSAERALAGDNITSLYAYDSTFVGALNGTLLINTAGLTAFYNCQLLCTNSTYYPIAQNPTARVIELNNCVVSGAGSKAIDNNTLCTIRANHSTAIYGQVLGRITRMAPPYQLMAVPSSLLGSNANIPSHTGVTTVSGSIGAGGLVYNSNTNTPAFYNGNRWVGLYSRGYTYGSYFLPEATISTFNSGNLPTGSYTTMFTVPTGFNAIIEKMRIRSVGATDVLQLAVVDNGTTYSLGYSDGATNGTVESRLPIVFTGGQVVSCRPGVVSPPLNYAVTGVNVSASIITFPTGSALRTSWTLNYVSGLNILYTCPVGMVARIHALEGANDYTFRITNKTNLTPSQWDIYYLPTTGTAIADQYKMSKVSTLLPSLSGEFAYGVLGGALTAGMAIALQVTNPVSGVAMITVQEYPV